MERKYVIRYKIRDGKFVEVKVDRETAFRNIDFVLKRDKEFLEIMSKM